MKYEDVKTVPDLCAYISQYASLIYVRAQVNGKWDSVSLTELPAQEAIKFALGFVAEGRIPVRLKAEGEE